MNATAKSLLIIKGNPGIRPQHFARLYFDADHPGWDRLCKAGPYGSARGTGLTLWSGGWKLRRRGLIDWETRLTPEGVALLESAMVQLTPT